MSSSTEDRLRDLFVVDAAAAPAAVGLVEGALRKVRHRRRVHMAWAAAVVGIVLGAGAVTTTGLAQRSPHEPIAAVSRSTSHSRMPAGQATASPGPRGPVPVDATTDCVETYSPSAVAGRAFAFDGTVTGIGPARSNRPGGPFLWSE